MKNSISFVIPCLNEQETLPIVLEKINKVCHTDFHDRKTEVIVSDNGSTDNSKQIAQKYGAKVVHCKEKGYGAALQFGIKNAINEVIVFADADNTYDFLETPKLVEELEKGFDFVYGLRLKGDIKTNAMPFLHRHLGTPILNFFINLLYSKDVNKVTDCNSGFRCFKRQSFVSWKVKSTGMEFASEMLVKAMKFHSKISYVPISLYPDSKDREPHLKTWRDGMRHLLQIFLESPEFFNITGSLIFIFSWLIMILGLLFGPISLGPVSIFGIHTMMFALLGSFFGLFTWSIGLFLSLQIPTRVKLYNFLINLPEDKLFWYNLLIIVISIISFLGIIFYWGMGGFKALSIERETLALISFASNGLIIVSNSITAHLIKKSLYIENIKN